MQRAGVEPTRVQIEITETAIFDDAERAAETLYKLRQMGFRIALDDFGTGYSSLYNIRKFALDCLKIDRSFIDGMGRERESGGDRPLDHPPRPRAGAGRRSRKASRPRRRFRRCASPAPATCRAIYIARPVVARDRAGDGDGWPAMGGDTVADEIAVPRDGTHG